MHPWLYPIAETIPEKFANLFLMLREAVGQRLRSGPEPRLDQALILRIAARLQKMKLRILSVLARIEAGTLRPPRPCRPRTPPPHPEREKPEEKPRPQRTEPRLPTHRAWLVRLAPGWQGVGPAGAMLAAMFHTQEFAFLIGQHPRLVAELRPLCRMLGVDPNLLPPWPPRLPRPTRPKRPPPPPAPKPPRRDEPIGPGSLLWSGAKPLAKGFRIRDWDVPRSKDKEAKFLRRVRI